MGIQYSKKEMVSVLKITTAQKRILGLLTAVVFVLTMLPLSGLFDRAGAAAADGMEKASVTELTGKGTKDEPYLIGSKEALESMRDAVNNGTTPNGGSEPAVSAYYELTADIDGLGDWTPISRSGGFKGTFDGNGHKITGMKVIRVSGSNRADGYYYGLFGQIGKGGTVKNLTIEGTANITGGWFVGLLAGVNEGNIENCYVKGTVNAVIQCGGIMGAGTNGTVKNCFADLSAESKGSSGAFGAIAGTAGANNITNSCYKNNGSLAVGTPVGDQNKNIPALTPDEIANGKAAWILRNAQGEEIPDKVYWGQKLGENGETEPALKNNDNDRVYRAVFMLNNTVFAEEFANKDGNFAKPTVEYDNDGQTAGDDWYEDAEHTGEKYDFDSSVSKDITLYGGEALTTYTITLDLKGGTLTNADGWEFKDGKYIKTYTKDDKDFDLPTPAAPTDQRFAGWVDESNSSENKKVTIAKGTTGNKSYKAVYKNAVGPEITVELNGETWNTILTGYTVFVKEQTATVTATATDEQDSEIKAIYYIVSDDELTAEQLAAKERNYWTVYDGKSVVVSPTKNNRRYVYFKATDSDGNDTYASSAAIVFDPSEPTISGIANGGTYCESIEFTVNDNNLATVTVDGEVIYNYENILPSEDSGIIATMTGDKKFSVKFDHTGTADVVIKATDKAGNETVYNVKINGQHVKGMTVTEMTRAASCVNIGEGTKLTYCKNCGLIIERNDSYTEPMLAHRWSDWNEVSSVLCGDTTSQRKCQFCGLTETETTGGSHEWEDDYTIDVQPTCLKPGQKSKHCKNCHISNPEATEVIPTLAHQPGEVQTTVVKDATCTADGGTQTLVLCSVCKSELDRTYTVIPAKGHDFTDWVKIQTPSDPESGTMKRECKTCGFSESASYHTDHVWSENKIVDKEATCTTDGSKSYHCVNCGTTSEPETIKALGHEELEPVKETVIEANCTTAGRYNEVVYCSRCKERVRSTPVTVPALGHKMGDWEVVETKDGKFNEQRQCTVCGITETRGTDLVNHSWNTEYTIDAEPTCTTEGSKSIHCTVCGLTKPGSSETIAAKNHEWGEWKTITSPDCDDEGTQERTCDVCGIKETSGLAANGHTWEDHFTTDKEPTCTTDGSKSVHCSKCDAVERSEVIPANGHSFGEWEEVKTATGESNQQRKCTVCGYTETRGTDLENHKWSSELTVDVEPTCTTEGSKSIHCTVCGLTKPNSSQVIEALGHKFGEWKTISSPDCDDEGTQERTCDVCGIKETSGLAANGHTWEDHFTTDKEPTCTTDGSKSVHCSKCDAVERSEVIPANGHSFGEWEEVKTATGESNQQRKCTVCGYTETRGTDLENHKWSSELTVDVEPTCTTEGSKSIHCTVCGLTKPNSSQVIEALGHKFGEWKTISSPDCDDEGTQERTCDVCGIKETSGLAANGHTWEDHFTTDKEPTCTTDGSKSVHCSKCDAVERSEVIPANGHSFGEWEEVKTATGESNQQRKCTVCGYTETRGTDLENHKWSSELTVDVEPTCTTEGSKSIHCTVCGLTKPNSSQVIEALGHKFGEWKTISSPDCDDEGTQERTCDVCGIKETSGLAANGHTWEDHFTTDKEPTCTTDGSKSVHCSKCDAVKESTAIPARGYHTTELVGYKPATAESDGYTGDLVCTECGETVEKGKVIPATMGDINVIPESGENAPAIKLTEDEIKAIEDAVLTDEDTAARENGEDIKVVITVENADNTVTAENKTLIEEAVKDAYEIGRYVNIDITKYIGNKAFEITELSKAVNITVEIPDDLKADGRKFAVVRLHGNDAEILDDIDDSADTITFSTDKFSTYAIVYSDTAAPQPGTGANDYALLITVLSAAAVGVAVMLRKKKQA